MKRTLSIKLTLSAMLMLALGTITNTAASTSVSAVAAQIGVNKTTKAVLLAGSDKTFLFYSQSNDVIAWRCCVGSVSCRAQGMNHV